MLDFHNRAKTLVTQQSSAHNSGQDDHGNGAPQADGFTDLNKQSNFDQGDGNERAQDD